VHEIPERDERLKEIAHEYAKKPEGTLVVSPDNQSRREINEVIHRTMQSGGQVEGREHKHRVLVAQQEITGADRYPLADCKTVFSPRLLFPTFL
jgi:hypothetical protein